MDDIIIQGPLGKEPGVAHSPGSVPGTPGTHSPGSFPGTHSPGSLPGTHSLGTPGTQETQTELWHRATHWEDRFRLYDENTYYNIEIMYGIGILLWIVLVCYFDLLSSDPVVIFILLLPILIYLLGMWSLSQVTIDDEEKLLASSYLSIGILVIVPLLTWTHDRFGEETKILQVIVVAIILAVMSLVDIWVPAKSLSLVRHFRSILQVAALILIIYVLYHIFLNKGNRLNPKKKSTIGGPGESEESQEANFISTNAAAAEIISRGR